MRQRTLAMLPCTPDRLQSSLAQFCAHAGVQVCRQCSCSAQWSAAGALHKASLNLPADCSHFAPTPTLDSALLPPVTSRTEQQLTHNHLHSNRLRTRHTFPPGRHVARTSCPVQAPSVVLRDRDRPALRQCSCSRHTSTDSHTDAHSAAPIRLTIQCRPACIILQDDTVAS